MSDESQTLPLDIPEPPRGSSLAMLRNAVAQAQAEAASELRRASEVSGEDERADELAEDFRLADEIQRGLLRYMHEWQERDGGCYDDDDEWSHPEGPLTECERDMLKAYQRANDRLNDLRMAIYALRARELAELQQAGAVVNVGRLGGGLRT